MGDFPTQKLPIGELILTLVSDLLWGDCVPDAGGTLLHETKKNKKLCLLVLIRAYLILIRAYYYWMPIEAFLVFIWC